MSTPGMPIKRRAIAYIDGYNLYHGLRDEGWRKFLWLDLSTLAKSLIQPGFQQLVSTKYFTTRISSPEEKRQRQSDYLEALGVHCGDSLKMFWGHYQSQPWTCRHCGTIEQVSQEKKTDVNIAVEMIADAYTDAFDSAIMITADSDLVPVVDAIHRLFKQKRVVVAFPPSRFSAELQGVADASFTIGRAKFSCAQMPEEVVKPNGTVLMRPSKWKDAVTPFGVALQCALHPPKEK